MKTKILLSIILTHLLLYGCAQPSVSPTPAVQTGPTPSATVPPTPTVSSELALVPFTSQALSIRGVAPEGWMKVIPGHFAGDVWPIDQLIHEVYQGMTIEIVTAAAMLPRLGRDSLPDPLETKDESAFAWNLYAIEIDDPNAGLLIVDLAMTEPDSGVYSVALVTRADDNEALREAVFLPAVEALEPIVFDQRDRATAEELFAADYPGDGPVNSAYF